MLLIMSLSKVQRKTFRLILCTNAGMIESTLKHTLTVVDQLDDWI